MQVEIDVDRLREALIDYYGSATFVGSPYAMGDVVAMDGASPEQLIRTAKKEGLDLWEFVVPGSKQPESDRWQGDGADDSPTDDDASAYDW